MKKSTKTSNPVPSTKPMPATKTTPGKVNKPEPNPFTKGGKGKC